MYEFQLWFVNFDAIFVRKQLVPTRIIIQALPYNPSQSLNWPQYYVAPKIGECFEQLQKFIKDSNNWIMCDLPDQKIQSVEQKINNIMILIATEKQYAIQFWGKQLRRIQASVCHFFILFQNLMASLIIYPHRTLKSCEMNGVLLTKFSLIQQLVNKILKNLHSLIIFLGRKQFRQQKELTKQFFQIFRNTIEKLPDMTVSQLTQSPKLMLYITINNPIEISEHLIQDSRYRKEKFARPKAQTVDSEANNILKRAFLTNKRLKKIQEQKNSEIVKSPRRNSCFGRLIRSQFEYQKRNIFNQKLVFFRFPQKLVRFSFCKQYQLLKKNTESAVQTTARQRRSSLTPNIKRKYTTVQDSANEQLCEKFINSVRVSNQYGNTRDKSNTQVSQKTSKRSQKSRERNYIKNLVQPDSQVKRQCKLKAKQAAFTAVKNLWSEIKFNQFVKKQPIMLSKGTQKRPIWAPQGYEQNKQDQLRQRLQDILYQDSQQEIAEYQQFSGQSTQ